MVVTPKDRKLLKEVFGGRPNKFFSPDAYKLWLIEEYEISKNEILGKFSCNEKLFDTAEEALLYAAEFDDLVERQESNERYEETKRRKKIEYWVGGIFFTLFVIWLFY